MDVVVTCPKGFWAEWIAEGDLPDEVPTGREYRFTVWGARPVIEAGERVYVVAHGRLRGYAPLVRVESYSGREHDLIRGSGAVAVTITEPIIGFRGWRYRSWSKDDELASPEWRTP